MVAQGQPRLCSPAPPALLKSTGMLAHAVAREQRHVGGIRSRSAAGGRTAGQVLGVQVGAGVDQDPGHLHVPKYDGTVQRSLACDSVALLDVGTRIAQQLDARHPAAPAGLVDGRPEDARVIRALPRREQTLHLLIVAARCRTGEPVEEQHVPQQGPASAAAQAVRAGAQVAALRSGGVARGQQLRIRGPRRTEARAETAVRPSLRWSQMHLSPWSGRGRRHRDDSSDTHEPPQKKKARQGIELEERTGRS